MVKASLGINIFAVLPLASNASSAVPAAMIVPAIITRTESKYFRFMVFRQESVTNHTVCRDQGSDNNPDIRIKISNKTVTIRTLEST